MSFLFCFFCFSCLFLSSIQLSPIPLLNALSENLVYSPGFNSSGFVSKYEKLYQTDKRTAYGGVSTLWWPGGVLVLRSQAACMENRKQRGRRDGSSQTWKWEEFAKCACFSLKGVVTGFLVIIFYLLGTGAKLISGGEGRRGQDH